MTSPPQIGWVSLGCPKALVDSERILTQLKHEGYYFTNTYKHADLIVINTCGFIEPAIEESMTTIKEALQNNGRVIVTGCLGKDAEKIKKIFPNVLAISGAHEYETVMEHIHEHLRPPHPLPWENLTWNDPVKLTPRHYAYLKISEGCNHHCTFCIIPHLRGKLHSRPLHQIMQEAENLVLGGVKELLIIAQDTSAYGSDLHYQTDFWKGKPYKSNLTNLATLLGELNVWTRFHYIYPYPNVDELIPLMSDEKVLPYLDIPLQHASPSILKAMRRPASSEKMLEKIQSWRTQCSQLTLRSTFIVGFPGETDDDFEQLLNFLEVAEFDRVGAFMYSPVAGATANTLENPIPDETKTERYEALMALQSQISAKKLKKRVGQIETVMIDENDNHRLIGRSFREAPEIDGVIYIENTDQTQPGDRKKIVITSSDEHDLYGRILGDP